MKSLITATRRARPSTGGIVRLAIVTTLAITLFSVYSQPLEAGSTHTPWPNLTQPALTAVWWQWILDVPVSISPWFDTTGAQAATAQPYFDAPGGSGSLLFLIGTIIIQQLQNGDVLGQVTRTISVKQGTALFFPLINTEWDNTCNQPHLGGNCFGLDPFPQVVGVPELRARAAASIDAVTTVDSTVTPTDATFTTATGAVRALGIVRLQSPPFAYSVPATDNIYQSFGISGITGTVGPAVSDGYWSFIPGSGANSLTAGHYVLRFGGSFPINSQGNTFTEDITYHITVTP